MRTERPNIKKKEKKKNLEYTCERLYLQTDLCGQFLEVPGSYKHLDFLHYPRGQMNTKSIFSSSCHGPSS